jgi:hypothetical protein
MIMYNNAFVVVLPLLAALASAIPSPVELAPRCGTTLAPSTLRTISENNPASSSSNEVGDQYYFQLYQSLNSSGRSPNFPKH